MLLIIPSIIIGESLTSYLYRLARANFLNVFKLGHFFCFAYKNIIRNNYSIKIINHIASMTKHSPEALMDMTFSALKENFEHRVNRIYLLDKVQYCPICISTRVHLKKAWLYSPLNICLDHNITLVRICWKCQKEICLVSFFEGKCPECSSQYNRAPVNILENSQQLNFQQELLHIFSSGEYKLSIGSFTFEQFLQLVFRSCYLLDKTKIYFQKFSPLMIPCLHPSSLFMNVLWMYKDFPNNFVKVLNEFSGIKMYSNRLQFEMLFADKSFKKIQDAYYDFWIKEIANGNTRKPPAFLISNSYYMGKDYLLPKNTYFALNEHKIESFINKINNQKQLISRSEAAFLLGFNRSLIRKLIEKGVFSLTVVGKRELLLYEEVWQFRIRCRGEKTMDFSGKMKLRQALNIYAPKGLSLLKVIHLIFSGYLNPYHFNDEGTILDTAFLVTELVRETSSLRAN